MDFKNKVSFFLLSFLISFSLFYIGQQYVATDLTAYVLGIFFVVTVPLLLYFVWPKLNNVLIGLILLVGLFLLTKAYPVIDKNPIKLFFFEHRFDLLGTFIGSVIITALIKKYFIGRQDIYTKKLSWGFMKSKYFTYIVNIIVFLLLFFLIFNPKYKYSLEKLSLFGYESFHEYHHVTYFLSPIHEILLGKTLLINVSSFYGIISTYINSFVFKFFKLTYPNFVLYTTLVSIFYSTILFLILKKVSKSFWLALIGTLAFIRLTFFRDFAANTEIFIFPSTTPIRYFFDIIILYFVFDYFQRPMNFKRLLLISVSVIFFIFYSLDYGIFVLIAYLATLIFDIFLDLINRKKLLFILTKINKYIVSIFIPLIIFGLLLVLFTFLRSGVFPDINKYVSYLLFQTSQFQKRNFPTVIGWQHLPLLIYLIGFYFIFYQTLIKKKAGYHGLVFILVLGLLSFTYYINMSEPNHLFPYLHPAIIIFIFMLKSSIDNLKDSKNNSLIIIFLATIFFFGVFWAIFMYPQPFTNLISERIRYRYSPITNKYYYWNYPSTNFYLQDDDGKNFELAVKKIKEYSKNKKEIVIISRYSVLLYLMSGKTSLINHPNPETDVYSALEFNEIINMMKTKQPQFIFVYSLKYNQSYIQSEYFNMNNLWNKIKKDYAFKESAGAIDVYELKKF